MPCYDSRTAEDNRRNAKAAAMLCAVLTAIDNTGRWPDVADNVEAVMDKIDYKEGGFTRAELEAWWENHKAEDEA